MRLDKAIDLKFEDGLTKLGILHLYQCDDRLKPFYRKDYILNTPQIYNDKMFYSEIQPSLIRRRQGKNFYGRIKDFNWEEFEKNFLNLNSSSQIEDRIYSNFREYLDRNNLWEFLVEAKIDKIEIYPNVDIVSFKIGFTINGYEVNISSSRFKPMLFTPYLGTSWTIDLLYRLNPYLRSKLEIDGYITYQCYDEDEDKSEGIIFANFTADLFDRQELWNDVTFSEVFSERKPRLWSDKYTFIYTENLQEIYQKFLRHPELKNLFLQYISSRYMIFYDYADFQTFKKLDLNDEYNFFPCNFPLSQHTDFNELEMLEEYISEKDIQSNLKLDYTDLIKKKLRENPDNPEYWLKLLPYGNLLFKDIIPGAQGLTGLKYLALPDFYLQKRLIKRDFYKERLVKALVKMTF